MVRKSPPRIYLALSPAEVALALGVRRDQVADAIKTGALPVHALGTKRKILCSDVEQWVRSWPAPTRKPNKRKVPSDAR